MKNKILNEANEVYPVYEKAVELYGREMIVEPVCNYCKKLTGYLKISEMSIVEKCAHQFIFKITDQFIGYSRFFIDEDLYVLNKRCEECQYFFLGLDGFNLNGNASNLKGTCLDAYRRGLSQHKRSLEATGAFKQDRIKERVASLVRGSNQYTTQELNL